MRRGFTLIELFVAILIGFIVLFSAINLLAGARRGEFRTNQAVDVAEEVGAAISWITRDLQALDHAPGEPAVRTNDAEDRMEFRVRDGSVSANVTYAFDATRGELLRTASDGATKAFLLGKTASVIFRPIDPSFAGGGQVALGKFNNRLVYRITAKREGPLGVRSYTLIGAVPFLAKASRDTFRFWNNPAPAPQV